ncbi:MAG TPA: ATP-binding cassette domain-containing protein [Chitinophagaceae bacterium]|jgi:molybdate transport system ATP-binding protein
MQQELAVLQQVSVRLGGVTILDTISLVFQKGEQWAVVGASGSGKTTLAHAMAGKVFFRGTIDYSFPISDGAGQQVVVVEQQHKFKNRSNTSDFYYQQRFNAADADNSLTVAEELADYTSDTVARDYWLNLLHMVPLVNKPLLQLSNGENKRLQLVKALLEDPALLVLDQPFTGLDVEGRKTLHGIINTLAAGGRHLLLVTSAAELPGCITHVAILEKGRLAWAGKKEDAQQHLPPVAAFPLPDPALLRQLPAPTFNDFNYAVKLVNTTVRYGDKIILDALDWEVKKGERWNLSGPNGAGKSTLLSLITADNPQAYANEIYLFDRRRGSGESIWDIKQKTGFVSPELHIYFEQGITCFEVVASGLFDTIGLFRRLSEEQETAVMDWMRLLQMDTMREKSFHQISTGQQRMLLLARALIKNPPLLILDEPYQGLDDEQSHYFKELVNSICEVFPSTLIYVSHYQKDIPSCVTKFLRLEEGKRVEE